MADIEILRYLATKTGLGLNYLSKDEKISIILEQQRDLFPEVVLKGETALSRVYLAKKGVSRFSEDIYLDFISDKGLNEKISTIKDRVKEIKGFDIFKVYSFEDLMARKFIALYNRMEGKDIYDLFYCLDLEFDKKNLDKALKFVLDFYKLSESSFVNELLLRLREARKNAYYIGNSTNHFIPRNLRPDWKVFFDTLILKIEGVLGEVK